MKRHEIGPVNSGKAASGGPGDDRLIGGFATDGMFGSLGNDLLNGNRRPDFLEWFDGVRTRTPSSCATERRTVQMGSPAGTAHESLASTRSPPWKLF
jgi:hypothetical protein